MVRHQLAALGLLGLLLVWSGAAAAAPAANLDQIRNGAGDSPIEPPNWVNGNAGSETAHYVEGWSIGYRCVMTELPLGTPVTLVLEYDLKHSSRHAIDYLTHYQRLGNGEHLGAFGHPIEHIDPTLGVPGIEGTPYTSIFPLPAPTSIGSPTPGMPTDSFNALPADQRVMTLWGGDLTGIVYGPQGDLNLAQSAQTIEVTFTPTSATAVLAWGGHIGDRDDWGYETDGTPLSAGGISGSPYHMRLIDWNLTNLGNQDRSLNAVAVYTPPPVCNVDPSTQTICEGGSATFTDYSTGGVAPYTWSWTKPPSTTVLSSTSSLTISNALPAQSGQYRVIVTDFAGKADTCYADLTVVPTPDVDAGADGVLNCLHPQITLSGSSTTLGVTYAWVASGGGHIVSGADTATPVVDEPGTYTLTVTEPIAGCTDTDAATVTEDVTPPDVSAGGDMTLTCLVTSVTLDGSSTTPGVTYLWTTADGHIVSGAATASPVVDEPGTYTLTVTNPANGCEASDSADVDENVTPPDVDAGADMTLTCVVTSVTLDGSSRTPGVTYLWSTLDGHIVSGGATAHPVVDEPGTYTLTVTDPVNGCTATDEAAVSENVDRPDANAGGDMVLTCVVTSVTLDGSSSTPGVTYLWTTADGHIVSGAATADPVVDEPGTYTLTVTDPVNGCQATDTAEVTENVAPPDAHAGADTTLTCAVAEILLHGTSSTPGVTYCWTLPGPVAQNPCAQDLSVSAPGRYILTVTNPVNGCAAKDTVDVFQDIEPPAATLYCPGILPLCGSEGNTLGATGERVVSWDWLLTGDGWAITGGQGTNEITYSAGSGEAVFRLIVTAANGCADTTSVTCECQAGEEYCTYTMGGWGSGCPDSQAGNRLSTQPGCIRDHYFDTVFADGVTIGLMSGGYHATWTTAAAVEAYLPAGGKPLALRRDYTDPLETNAGVLAGQILALKLNVAYSAAGIFAILGLQEEASPLGGYVIPDSCGAFAGMTVADFLALADSVVGGRTDLASPSAINFTATCLNESFNDCSGPEDPEAPTITLNSGVPARTVLDQNRPNPFNPQCEIRYGLHREGHVRLAVYDLRGRLVRSLVDAVEPAGFRSVLWNGIDNGGRRVTSGVYFYRLVTDDFSQTMKMVLLK